MLFCSTPKPPVCKLCAVCTVHTCVCLIVTIGMLQHGTYEKLYSAHDMLLYLTKANKKQNFTLKFMFFLSLKEDEDSHYVVSLAATNVGFAISSESTHPTHSGQRSQ